MASSDINRLGRHTSLSQEALEQILEVARNLASTFDTTTILSEVVDAARSILLAERVSVFLYEHDTNELVIMVATGLGNVRIPADRGIAGECLQTNTIISVADCYADERFNRSMDIQTGYRTQCMMSMPLIGFGNSMVGVMQLLNKKEGTFSVEDEKVASWLGSQVAVALQRVRMTEAMLTSQKLDREINVARDIQMSSLPQVMPEIPGYDVAGTFKPTDQTGGDTFDFVKIDDHRMFVLLADATGHGIGPALSATQVRAMLRVALRLGADLDSTFVHINDQLVEDLPDGRFVTAFLGLLDAERDRIHFHAGGQGPICHFHAATGEFDWHEPSTFPLGFMPQADLDQAKELQLAPGDVLGLISDGVYEYENEDGAQFGTAGVAEVIRANHERPMTSLVDAMMDAVTEYGGSAPQFDDITIVVLRRT